MIDVKEAVKKAREYLFALYGDDKLYDVDLEEVDRDINGFWNVTLGFAREARTTNMLAAKLAFQMILGARQYKVFKIDADTGDVVAMKMRSPAA